MLSRIGNLAAHWRAIATIPVVLYGLASWPRGSTSGALLVTIGTAALIIATIAARGPTPSREASMVIALATVLGIFVAICLSPFNAPFVDALPGSLRAAVGGVALVSLALSEERRRSIQLSVGFVLIIMVSIGLVILLAQHPNPPTDVVFGHRVAAEVVLEGGNPYADAEFSDTSPGYANVGIIEGYAYPPASMIPYVLSEVVLDARLLSILAIAVLAAVILWSSASWTSHSLLMVGCFLAYPMLGSLIVHAWTEPLQLILIVGAGLALRKPIASGILGGLAIASKQYMILAFVPLAMVADTGRKARLTITLTVAAVSILPYLLWNPPAFWDALVASQLDRVQRLDTLSIASFGLGTSIVPAALAATGVAILLAWKVRSVAVVLLAQASSLAVYFTLSSNSFRNYFWLVAMLTMFALADGRDDVRLVGEPRSEALTGELTEVVGRQNDVE